MQSMRDLVSDRRELCYRKQDGIEVRLVWISDTYRVGVCVADAKLGHSSELRVDPASALRVFHHPYPCAAERGVLGADAFGTDDDVRCRSEADGS